MGLKTPYSYRVWLDMPALLHWRLAFGSIDSDDLASHMAPMRHVFHSPSRCRGQNEPQLAWREVRAVTLCTLLKPVISAQPRLQANRHSLHARHEMRAVEPGAVLEVRSSFRRWHFGLWGGCKEPNPLQAASLMLY